MYRLSSSRTAKKGSLSLSINAIVVLILAITMLGLGLAFIRGLFGGAVQKLTDIYAGLSEEDKKTLSASQEEITFLQSDVKVSGREVTTPFAIRNIRADKIGLKIRENFVCFDAVGVPKNDPSRPSLVNNVVNPAYLITTASGVVSVNTQKMFDDLKQKAGSRFLAPPSAWINFLTYDDRDFDAGKADVLPLTIRVAAGAQPTTYSCALAPTIIRGVTLVGGANQFVPLLPGPDGFDVYATKYFNIIYTK